MTTKIFSLLAGVLLGLAIGYFIAYKQHHHQKNAPAVVNANPTFGKFINPTLSCYGPHIKELRSFKHLLEQYITQVKSEYPDLHVSYYFRDLANGIWIGINEKEEFSPASLLKLPVMIAVLKETERNPDFFNKSIQYKASDFSGVTEEAGYVKQDGKFYTIEELISHMISYSDNAATLLLHQYVGEEKVRRVEDFLHQHVPEGGTGSTNFISVKNYAAAFRVLYNCSYLGKDMSERALTYLATSHYTGGIRSAVPDSIPVAHKYGIRDNGQNGAVISGYQLHHFGIVYYPGKPYLLGIMTRGATKKKKEEVIKHLSEITFKQVSSQMNSNEFYDIVP